LKQRIASVRSVAWGQLTTPAATAQNTISLASNISRRGAPAPLACQQEAGILAQGLIEFPRPSEWHWIIVCDDAGWNQFLLQRDHFTHESASEETIYASTDLTAHVTCLRGSTLLKPDTALAAPAHVIAHELAHIILNTASEDRAEQQAAIWLRSRLVPALIYAALDQRPQDSAQATSGR
jgi:hypothetical protein